jgi:hypothetical protein
MRKPEHFIPFSPLRLVLLICTFSLYKARQAFLDFFGDKIAFQTAGADFQRYGGAPQLGFYLNQIGFPGAAGMVFRVAHRIAGNRMFSANIADP